MPIYQFKDKKPAIAISAYVAPEAEIIGDVNIGECASVWFQTVIRGDTEPIQIGENSNIQDLSMCHADPGIPLTIGKNVSVGHKCILHGCTIEDDCLIGMGAIIMNHAKIGQGSIIGAGAVVLEKTIIPPFSLVVGSPAKVKKTYDKSIINTIRQTASNYVKRRDLYKNQLTEIQQN